LTTLEWLLVVAAVAGLAALAVVLVQSAVSDTADQLSQVNRRQVAFDVATTELTDRWAGESPASPEDAERFNRDYAADCRELAIIYADVPVTLNMEPGEYDPPPAGWKIMPSCTFH
jgi:type II secretory pathway pseudopilin PulG